MDGTNPGDSEVTATTARTEAEVFAELAGLCTSPGYLYALALIHLVNADGR